MPTYPSTSDGAARRLSILLPLTVQRDVTGPTEVDRLDRSTQLDRIIDIPRIIQSYLPLGSPAITRCLSTIFQNRQASRKSTRAPANGSETGTILEKPLHVRARDCEGDHARDQNAPKCAISEPGKALEAMAE